MPDKEQSQSVTEDMVEAGVRVLDTRSPHGTFRNDVRSIYEAMHAARPTPDLGKDEELCERLELRILAREAELEAYSERIEALHAEREKLRNVVDDLQQAEAEYRLMHDRHGDGSRAAGRAWDLMRRAGDKARAALSIGETDYCGIVVVDEEEG